MRKIILLNIVFCFFVFGCQPGGSGGDGGGNGGSSTQYEAPQSQGTTYWWNDTVFYEIFVRSFYDSDGDGIGDLKGLIAKLDYLNDGDPNTGSDLGITGIWLMPVCESPSYHGYDVVDYRAIETDYGTRADFLELTRQARARGIKIIVDLVLNHSSDQHPWFTRSAARDGVHDNWYRWSGNRPSYNGPWGQQVWHLHANGSYYYGLFWGGMPDLNYNEPAVYNEVIDISRFWLQDMEVDGFRLDAVKYIYEENEQLENLQATYDFWRRYRTDIKNIKGNALTVGEAWDNTDVVVNYVDGKLDFCFEFDLATSMLNGVNVPSPSLVIQKMKELKDVYPYHQYGVFLTNHDQDRAFSRFNENLDNAKLAGAVYLTLPGVPFIYYGEEIGMRGVRPGDENVRRPMQWDGTINAGFSAGTPWMDVDNNYTTSNVETLRADNNSIWNYYRKFITARSNYNALDRGTYQALHASSGSIYAFVRQHNNQIVIVLHNYSASTIENPTIDIDRTNIPAGTYTTTELINGGTGNTLQVDANGGFSSWVPLSRLEPKRSYLLLLQTN